MVVIYFVRPCSTAFVTQLVCVSSQGLIVCKSNKNTLNAEAAKDSQRTPNGIRSPLRNLCALCVQSVFGAVDAHGSGKARPKPD
jgi:hypothetical protein